MSNYRKCLLCKEVKDRGSQFTIESWKCDKCVKPSGGTAKAPPPVPPTPEPTHPPKPAAAAQNAWGAQAKPKAKAAASAAAGEDSPTRPGFVPPDCSQCGNPILGPALDAMQGKWHPDCFLCCICGNSIKEVDFAIVDGTQAHEGCRPKPLCCKCDTPIGGMILTALNQKWHEACFRCVKCDCALAHQKFFIEEDDDGNEVPLCENCTPKPEPCANCGQPVDRGIVALDATWHPHCFVCGKCKKSLDGPFFPKGQVPYCSKECYLGA